MSKLRLGPIQRPELVRVTVALPSPLKADLDRYAALHADDYGEAVDAAGLIPHMLEAFLARDRDFRRRRGSLRPSSSVQATERATSSTVAAGPPDTIERDTP